jgi:hypothetical protein
MMKPVIMGGLMGLMMWMLHGAMSGGDTLGAMALIGFAAAHVVLLLIGIGAALFAASLSPRVRDWINRLHKPSLHHVVAMFGSAIAVFGIGHLSAHGLGGV